MMRNWQFLRMRRFARLSCAVFLLLGPTRAQSSIREEFRQSRIGADEYAAGIRSLEARSPEADALSDAAEGDLTIYCTGGYACSTPGVDAEAAWPSGAFVRAIAASGCIITGGDAEQAYRAVAQKYVARYNKAKLEALNRRGPARR
jgi:hypothetical protein